MSYYSLERITSYWKNHGNGYIAERTTQRQKPKQQADNKRNVKVVKTFSWKVSLIQRNRNNPENRIKWNVIGFYYKFVPRFSTVWTILLWPALSLTHYKFIFYAIHNSYESRFENGSESRINLVSQRRSLKACCSVVDIRGIEARNRTNSPFPEAGEVDD